MFIINVYSNSNPDKIIIEETAAEQVVDLQTRNAAYWSGEVFTTIETAQAGKDEVIRGWLRDWEKRGETPYPISMNIEALDWVKKYGYVAVQRNRQYYSITSIMQGQVILSVGAAGTAPATRSNTLMSEEDARWIINGYTEKSSSGCLGKMLYRNSDGGWEVGETAYIVRPTDTWWHKYV